MYIVYTNVYCPLNARSGRQLVNLGEKILQLHASGDSQTDGRGKTPAQKKLNIEISINIFSILYPETSSHTVKVL